MKSPLMSLAARDDGSSYTPTMTALLITLVVLVLVALLCIVALYFMRWRKRSAAEESLPLYDEKRASSSHHRMTIRPHESILVYQEKQNLIENSSAPPTASAVPEIRITFPEEFDDVGKRQSGRVVVVRVGDHSIGLEPVESDNLPPYQKSESDRFHSLDLDRIGGLKEKEVEARWQ